MTQSKNIFWVIFLFPLLFLTACISNKNSLEVISKRAGDNTINIHQLGDPVSLNPFLGIDEASSVITGNIFQSLLTNDPITSEIKPLLAVSRPTITLLNEGKYAGGLQLEYEIKEIAVWDDGSPITGHDYAFSLKAIKNPLSNTQVFRPFYEALDHVEVDKNNPKKFTVFATNQYILVEEVSGTIVIPEHIYDPQQLMRKFSISQLNDAKQQENLRKNKNIIAFAKSFNSEKHARENGFISGSGPYTFHKWKTRQYIELVKKENWWGDDITDIGFSNHPEKLTYLIVPDWTTAITALKDEQIDLAKGIRAKDFISLKENKRFSNLYETHSPNRASYELIGINTRKPILADKKVRKALNHLVNRKIIKDVLMYGFGKSVVSPIYYSKSYYNKSIVPYDYNLEKAKAYLNEAGWKDTDGNGQLDKVIDGIKQNFEIDIIYNQGNTRRENIAMFFKEEAKKVGITVNVQVREWTVMLEDMKSHKFDLYISGMGSAPGLDDLKQTWHSESYNGGSNNVGFGTAESDALIDAIRYNNDEASRTQQYLKLQEIIHEEAPCIFLLAPQNKMAFHKRFDEKRAFDNRPGFLETEWVINQQFGQSLATQ